MQACTPPGMDNVTLSRCPHRTALTHSAMDMCTSLRDAHIPTAPLALLFKFFLPLNTARFWTVGMQAAERAAYAAGLSPKRRLLAPSGCSASGLISRPRSMTSARKRGLTLAPELAVNGKAGMGYRRQKPQSKPCAFQSRFVSAYRSKQRTTAARSA